MSSEYAQIELCYAYGHTLATHPLDLEAFRAILAPDVKHSFLPLSFGAPKIEGIDNSLGAVQHVVGGLTDLEYVIDGSEGRANYTGKNRPGEPFHNQIITRTRIAKCEDGKLRFSEISEYIDPEAEKIMMKGGEETAAAAEK